MYKSNIKYEVDTEELARLAKALAHPTRILILKFLSKQNFCYTGNLTEDLPIAQSTISRHLKELRDVGLIYGVVNAPKIRYCIDSKKWLIAKKLMIDLFDRHIADIAYDE